MESLSFPEVATQPVSESRSQVHKTSETIESTKDANTVLKPSESNPDFITSPNRLFDSDLASGEFAFKQETDNTSKKTYECDKCHEKSFNRTSFIRHYKSHSAKNLTVSSNSQTVISHEFQLQRKRTGTLEQPFACDICKTRFTRKSYLNQHLQIHTDKRPFVCDICNKAFKRDFHFTRHYRIHTNEKPFVCDICEMGFAQKNGLVHHERTHAGEKPYECDVCEKRFNHKSNLLRHHRTHTGEKP